MLSFRDRELKYPAFDFHRKTSNRKTVQLEKHHSHTFMPYYCVNICLGSRLTRQRMNALGEKIRKEFGYIPFGFVKQNADLIGLSFSIKNFVEAEFVSRLSKMLVSDGFISSEEAERLCESANLQCHLLREYIQVEKSLHKVPSTQIPLIRIIDVADPSLQQVARLLENHAVDVNAQDGYGNTALSMAVRKNRVDLVKLLLGRGADPHIVDWFGSRPLDSAAYTNKLDVAKTLLEYGANPNIYWGDSPLHSAFAMASDEMVELLASYGAHIFCVNQHGETPVNQSINRRHDDKGKAVERRVKAVERGRQQYMLKNPNEEELQDFMRLKLLAEIEASKDPLLDKLDATYVSVQSGILRHADLFGYFRKFPILGQPMHQSQYNVWFRTCLLLHTVGKLAVPGMLSVKKSDIKNLSAFKVAFLNWVKTLDKGEALNACQMACDQSTFVGQLMYQRRGWYAPSFQRGTLKEIHMYMQELMQDTPIKAPVKHSSEYKALIEQKKVSNVQHKVVTEYDAICNKLNALTKNNLYPKLSSQQDMDESLQALTVKHEHIELLQAKKRTIESDVDNWLFGYSMFARPVGLPEPLQPERGKCKKQDSVDGAENSAVMDHLLSTMPSVPQHQQRFSRRQPESQVAQRIAVKAK